MKKLMIAAVASVAAVGAFAVESANIVGYGEANLNENYTGVGPMFFAIGQDVTSIQDIKIKGLDFAMGGGYTIAPITQGGNIPVKYFYWCGLSDYGVKDGWYTTDDGTTIEEAAGEGKSDDYLASISMAKGEGLVTQMTDSGLTLQGAGEVLTGDFTRPLNENYTGVANPFPVNIGIQSYAITGLDFAMGGGYTIAPITQGGNIPTKYFYWCGLSDYGVKDGWYTTDDGTTIEEAAAEGKSDDYLADYEFKPGEAAVAQMTDAGLGLKITSPIK